MNNNYIYLYKSLLQLSPDAILVIDSKKSIIDANSKARDIFSGNSNNINIIAGLLAGKQQSSGTEIELEKQDGTIFSCNVHADTVPGYSATNQVYLVIIKDISKQKKKDNEIKQSNKSYHDIVESINEGIIVIDRNRLFSFINPGASKILGYSFEEILGSSIDRVLDSRNKNKLEKKLLQSEVEKDSRQNFELELISKKSEKIYAKITTTSIYGIKGDYLGSFAILTDITREKKATREKKRIENELRDIYLEKLSDRELELLRYLTGNYTWPDQKREIAKMMDVLPGTLDKFLARIKSKLQMKEIGTIIELIKKRI